jgi:hypothetical protein
VCLTDVGCPELLAKKRVIGLVPNRLFPSAHIMLINKVGFDNFQC